MEEVKSIVDKPVVICILGLKSDLEPVIEMYEIEDFLLEYLCSTYHSFSSKNSSNSDKINEILLNLLEKYDLMAEDYSYYKEIKNDMFRLDGTSNNQNKYIKKNKNDGGCC